MVVEMADQLYPIGSVLVHLTLAVYCHKLAVVLTISKALRKPRDQFRSTKQKREQASHSKNARKLAQTKKRTRVGREHKPYLQGQRGSYGTATMTIPITLAYAQCH